MLETDFIFHLKTSMMVHFPASYNSNSYLADYSRIRGTLSKTVSLHIIIVAFAMENFYCKWCFVCPVCLSLFSRKSFMLSKCNL